MIELGTGTLNTTLSILVGLGAGVVAGALFFGGLLLTTRRLVDGQARPLRFVGSFLIRMAVVTAGAWVVATTGGLAGVAAYLTGLLAARTGLVALVRRGNATNA